jgi:hypothetical protein
MMNWMLIKPSLGLGIYLGVGALFPMTDNLDALVEPSFLYRINPVTVENYPLERTPALCRT